MASRLQKPATLQPGQILGKCRIVEKLGRGGMGEVYLAQHESLQKRVAVKILPPELTVRSSVERFLKEARLASQVEHNNVVSIYDVDEQDGTYFIVMQYVEGKNLSQVLKLCGGRVPWPQAVQIIRLAAKGLQAVHKHGWIHRDIKPSNIMLAGDGRVVLMDFGLVRDEQDLDATSTRTIVGTVPYMSPEQCSGQALDRRSDIFSLGSTIYTLLTGQLPFQGSETEIVLAISNGKKPRPIEQLVPDVPPAVAACIAKAMAFDPANRYQDAEQFARALGDAAKEGKRTAPESVLPTEQEWVTRAVPELELIAGPTETVASGTNAPSREWMIGGAVVAVLLLLALILNLATLPTAAPVSTRQIRIPAGYARYGNTQAELQPHLSKFLTEGEVMQSVLASLTEESVNRVHVPEFLIDEHEVTNGQYATFVAAKNRTPPVHWKGKTPPKEIENLPVVNVLYDDAVAYAQFVGKQLPTQDQWLRAFRDDTSQLYPWGNEFDANKANCFENQRFNQQLSAVDGTPEDRSPFGVRNMAGNASEMLRETIVVQGQTMAVCRGGGSQDQGFAYSLACVRRQIGLKETSEKVGFRCVKELPLNK